MISAWLFTAMLIPGIVLDGQSSTGILIRDVGTTNVPSEIGSAVACWDMEEASGTRSAIGGSCSPLSDCNLTDPSSVGNNTTDFIEGSAAGEFVTASADRIACAVATCTDITGITSNYSHFAFARHETDETGDLGIIGAENGTTGGVITYWDDSANTIATDSADGTDQVACGGSDTWAVDTWAYVGASVTGGATDEIQNYFNGETDGSPCPQEDLAASGDNFKISSGNVGYDEFDGQIDLSCVFNQSLSAAEHCYLCSCGILGNEFGQCTYSGSSFVATGQNVSQCGSCTLPADPSDPIQ
jgi:hypothetical protein